ncbi:MAG: 6-pyruvoyl tetrahydropterin synthase, partial [Methanobacterium paludis]|nr:6-pyruvoyl tetrahydropterin synthase [Methanobacterium paludis]
VLSVSYVAKKFYGEIAGISAGFLIMSSYLFSRLVSPLPETMALIFIPLAVYLYYKSVEDKKYLYAFLSGFMFLIIFATHQAATMVLFLIMTAIALFMTILRKKIRFFTSYLIFLVIPLIAVALTAAVIWVASPDLIQQTLMYGVKAVTGYSITLPNNEPISNLKYIAYLGILLIFSIAGGVVALKKRRNEDILIFIWILTVFLISKAYWFGINVYSIRLLIHLLIPFSILGGLGLSYLYEDFKKKEFPSVKVRTGFLIAIFVVASLFAITTVEDPNFGVIPKYTQTAVQDGGIKIPQMVPPTDSDLDLAKWFQENGDKKSSIISNNYYTNQFLLAVTGQPILSPSNSAFYVGWRFSTLNESVFNYKNT